MSRAKLAPPNRSSPSPSGMRSRKFSQLPPKPSPFQPDRDAADAAGRAKDDGRRAPAKNGEALLLHGRLKPAHGGEVRVAQRLRQIVRLDDQASGALHRAEQRQFLPGEDFVSPDQGYVGRPLVAG